jgi:SAM-dependent methyltransferase
MSTEESSPRKAFALPEHSDYRTEFYALYRSTHVGPRKGEATAQSHALRFPYWDFLLGPYLPLRKTARIADLGAGSGPIVSWLLHKGYTHAVGVDVSLEEVEAARGLGLPVLHAELNAFLEQHARSLDFIILRNVIEHFHKSEIVQILKLAHQALDDGGAVFIQVPNAESPFGARIRYGDFTHEVAFTSSSISQVLRVCGYQKILVGPVEPWIRGYRRILWKLVQRTYKCLLYAELGMRQCIVTQDLYVVAYR